MVHDTDCIGQESKGKEGLTGTHWPHHQKFIINRIPNSLQAPELQKAPKTAEVRVCHTLFGSNSEAQQPRLRSVGIPEVVLVGSGP